MPAHPGGTEQRQLGAREAEDANEGGDVFSGKGGRDGGDLAVEAVDELGAISPGDEELRLAEQRRTDGDLAGGVLGVDDVDAGGRDRDVVDVRAAAEDPAVVEKDGGALAGAALERFGDYFFPLAAAVPGALVLRLVAEGEDDAAEARVLGPDPRLAVGLATVVLAGGARSGGAAIERLAFAWVASRRVVSVQLEHVTDRSVASHVARVPAGTSVPHAAHESSLRKISERGATEALSAAFFAALTSLVVRDTRKLRRGVLGTRATWQVVVSIGKLAAGPAAGAYYEAALADGREDYYAGEGEQAGRWLGSGAASLDLTGHVGPGETTALLAARVPSGDATLGRPLGDGSVAGFDVTFKAPKSVSVLFGIGDAALAEQLVAGHDAALAEALGYLEREACGARRGAGGAQKVPGNGFVAAAFQHRASRAGDPLLHTHVVMVNRVQGPDGRWTALDGQRLYAHAKTAGFIYQAALRSELTERLQLNWTEVEKGTAEVIGVAPEVLRKFSTRRREIEQLMREHSTAAAATAALATRKGKDYDVSAGELREGWRERAAALGLDRAGVDELLARPREAAAPAEVLLDDLTRHAATFDRRDVVQAVAAAHRDGARRAELEGDTDRLLADAVPVQRVNGDRAYTTRSVLEAERALERRAREGRGADLAVARADLVEAALQRRELDGEQADMVRALTRDGDAIHVVRAPAGAGKTFALDAAREAWARSDIEVVGCALSAQAARELRDQAVIKATTISKLRHSLDHGDRLPVRGVLVVDEAGMVGTRDLAALAEKAAESWCKLVLVGDDRQLPEIEAGGSFRALARDDATELSVLRRQRDREEREVLSALREGRTASWARYLADRDRLVTADTAELLRDCMVDDWHAARRDGHDAVMLAHRRIDVADLNDRARTRLRDEGRLTSPDVALGDRDYAVGDEVVCRRNDRSLEIINGDRGVVEHVDAERARVRLADERRVELPASYAAEHLDHGYAITAHRAQGATYDRAFVLGSDSTDREWGYTAMTRHRDEARFYIAAPQPFLNQPARPIAEQDELIETVTRLFDTSRQQERALDALERHPSAAEMLRQLDRATADEALRSETAASLAAEREQTFALRRGRRQELARNAGTAEQLALHAQQRITALHQQLGELNTERPLKLPALEPEIRPGPDLTPDRGMDLGW